MAETIKLYLIPPPARKLTRAAALAWLDDWAGDYVRVVACGLNSRERTLPQIYGETYEMLAIDVQALIETCTRVVKTGKPERLAAFHEREARELPVTLRRLAEIVETRPTEHIGSWGQVYDQLARRLVELLAEREAA